MLGPLRLPLSRSVVRQQDNCATASAIALSLLFSSSLSLPSRPFWCVNPTQHPHLIFRLALAFVFGGQATDHRENTLDPFTATSATAASPAPPTALPPCPQAPVSITSALLLLPVLFRLCKPPFTPSQTMPTSTSAAVRFDMQRAAENSDLIAATRACFEWRRHAAEEGRKRQAFCCMCGMTKKCVSGGALARRAAWRV